MVPTHSLKRSLEPDSATLRTCYQSDIQDRQFVRGDDRTWLFHWDVKDTVWRMYNGYIFDDADLPPEMFEPGYRHPINSHIEKIKVEMEETKREVKRQKLEREGWEKMMREKEKEEVAEYVDEWFLAEAKEKGRLIEEYDGDEHIVILDDSGKWTAVEDAEDLDEPLSEDTDSESGDDDSSDSSSELLVMNETGEWATPDGEPAQVKEEVAQSIEVQVAEDSDDNLQIVEDGDAWSAVAKKKVQTIPESDDDLDDDLLVLEEGAWKAVHSGEGHSSQGQSAQEGVQDDNQEESSQGFVQSDDLVEFDQEQLDLELFGEHS